MSDCSTKLAKLETKLASVPPYRFRMPYPHFFSVYNYFCWLVTPGHRAKTPFTLQVYKKDCNAAKLTDLTNKLNSI